MVTGPGEAAELLRRREVLTPEKLKGLTRKSKSQILKRKPECMKESKGMKHPELIDRKEMRNRRTARCLGQEDRKPGRQLNVFETLRQLKNWLQSLLIKELRPSHQ